MPDDRDWAESDYSRLYHSVLTDPKFADIYADDRAWATYTRLLMASDASYPSPAPLPRSAGKYAIEKLATAGIIVVSAGHYTIPALVKERSARYGSGRGRPRYPSDKTPPPEPSRSEPGVEPESIRSTSEPRAGGRVSASSLDSLSDSEQRTARDDAEWPVLSWLASVGATIQPNGNGYHRDLVMLVERQGAVKVLAAMKARYAAGDRAPRQLLFGASNALEPIAREQAKPSKGLGPTAEEAENAFRR